MKIAVNGTIIDTEDIYMITPIRECFESHLAIVKKFTIKLFHSKILEVKKDFNLGVVERASVWRFNDPKPSFVEGKDYVVIEYKEEGIVTHGCFATSKEAYNFSETLDLYKSQLKELDTFRDSLIDIWAANQTDIPQYNLE